MGSRSGPRAGVHRELQDFDTALRFDAEGAKAARENGHAKPDGYSRVNLAEGYMAAGEMTRVQPGHGTVWHRWLVPVALPPRVPSASTNACDASPRRLSVIF